MLRLIILRLVRERRLMAVLLLSMCLVTGFLALGPLYIQALSVSDFAQRIDTASAQTFSVSVRNATPFSGDVSTIIDDNLGDYISEQRTYATTGGFSCGFLYDASIEGGFGDPSSTVSCYRPYLYDDLSRYVTVSEGRFPQDTNSDILEIVITLAASQEGDYPIGTRFIIGNNASEAITIEVVGLVEPILSINSPFWRTQTFPELTTTFYTSVDSRLDVSFAVTESAFDDLLSVTGEPSYVAQFDLLPDTLNAFIVDDLSDSLQKTENELSLVHPEITVSTAFTALLADYRTGIRNAQGPITILSFLVLILMLYNIVATASLILEQQSQEWSMMASRGGSDLQLIYIQFITTGLLGLIAAVAGSFVAYLIMLIIASVGPYASIIDASQIGAIPQQSIIMSIIAAIIMIVVLTIPAWVAASKSLQQLKSSIARAPKAPLWARYYLDLIILVAGFAFLGRLLSLSSDQPLSTVLLNPALLIDVLSQGSASTLFSDPFNLAGPILILLGASMLWLRIFPILIRLMGSLFANGDGLTVRLAFWNVERDPAHYAQLVLLLIGTLALGTSSLALSETRAVGGWAFAQAEVGADAVLTLNPATYDEAFDWDSLPTVVDAVPLIRLSTQLNDTGALIALNPAEVNNEAFQAVTAPFELLGTSDFRLPGLQIPENTRQLQVDIYAREPQEEGVIDTQLVLVIEDQLGVRQSLQLLSEQSTQFGEFFTYQADLPDFGVQPYRITRFELLSDHNNVNEFEHVVYLDNLVAIDALEQSTIINRFEPDTYDLWQWNAITRSRQVLESTAFSNDTQIVSEGEHSLRILHLMRDGSRDGVVNPAIASYNNVPLPPIPIVVSQSFANTEGQASRFRRPLQTGDSLSVSLNIPTVDSGISREDFSYIIVGVVPNEYPSFVNDERLIFADYNIVRYRLNTYSFTSQFPALVYDVNTVWFELAGRTPSPEFVASLQNTEYLQATYAWDRFSQIQRDPLTNAVTGILFAGFWVSLFLSLLDFGFYMAITIRRRSLTFATLQAIGWNERDLLRLLLVEQVAFITPAIIIGIIFGMLLANLILPFLSLIGSLQLQVPLLAIISLILVLIVAFALILRLTAIILNRLSINQVIRFGE